MGEWFPKPNSLGVNKKVDLDLFNYATKSNSKNATETLKCFTKKDCKKQIKKNLKNWLKENYINLC